MNNDIQFIIDLYKEVQYVSFDIFDTLLSRPFNQPTDLFLLIEKEKSIEGFASERIKAEQRAREEHKEQADVTLEQIYDTISEKYKHLKEDELSYEYDFLYPKPEGKLLYEAAVSQGKKIIATSDMYLPSDFLNKVLKKNGYTAISRIFVSNEENSCKGDGSLFKKVLQSLNIEATDMIHIGDNFISDKSSPENLNIHSAFRPKDTDKILADKVPFNEIFKAYSTQKDLDSSVTMGIYAYHNANGISKDPLKEIGYILGGPLAVGYALYIDKIARQQGNDGLLFVSRDGYALQEVYNLVVSNPIANYYIQASRKLILRNSIDYSEKVYRENVLKMYADEQLQGKSVSLDDFDLYAEEMREWASKNKQNYTKYVDGLNISGNKLMTIDMTTREYTSLKLLTMVLGERIDCGLFSISYGEPCKLKALSYAKNNWKVGDEPIIMLQEQLITAPDFSVLAINDDGSFTYNNKQPFEKMRIENYKSILAGVIDFAKDYHLLYGNHKVPFSLENWWKNAELFLRNASRNDKLPFYAIFHDDAVRGTYDSLYGILFYQKETTELKDKIQKLKEKIDVMNNKKGKHLKWMRRLLFISLAEFILLLLVLILK